MRTVLASWGHLDVRLVRAGNRVAYWRLGRVLFAAVSRLGDGVAWYGLMAALLLLGGPEGLAVAWRMALAGGACYCLYRWLKQTTGRPRPCAVERSLRTPVAPLDEFSFPSGHTMHACAFALVAISGFPALAVFLLPFVVLIAASRLVLGLHYASDVLAGAVLGLAVALAVLCCAPLS